VTQRAFVDHSRSAPAQPDANVEDRRTRLSTAWQRGTIPDNQATGDTERFTARSRGVRGTLEPALRAKYDVAYDEHATCSGRSSIRSPRRRTRGRPRIFHRHSSSCRRARRDVISGGLGRLAGADAGVPTQHFEFQSGSSSNGVESISSNNGQLAITSTGSTARQQGIDLPTDHLLPGVVVSSGKHAATPDDQK